MTIFCHRKVNNVTGVLCMNKLLHRNEVSNFTSDISNETLNDINGESRLAWNYSLIDVDELSGFVINTAKEAYRTLGSGLPICVYQLKLFNDLTKEGLKLKSGKSMLNHHAEENGVRNLIVVNDVLVVEYISSVIMSGRHEKIIQLDNNYAMGLLVNISEDKKSEGQRSEKQNIKITKIDQSYIAH